MATEGPQVARKQAPNVLSVDTFLESLVLIFPSAYQTNKLDSDVGEEKLILSADDDREEDSLKN